MSINKPFSGYFGCGPCEYLTNILTCFVGLVYLPVGVEKGSALGTLKI